MCVCVCVRACVVCVVSRYLLGFGEVSYYLGYNAMTDYFPRYAMKPNAECDNKDCVKRQEEYKAKLAAAPKVEQKKQEEPAKPKHETNEVLHSSLSLNILESGFDAIPCVTVGHHGGG